MKRLVLVVACLFVACGGPKANAPSATQVVGTPPSPDEDPYFYVARPPPEAKASKSGTIGEPDPEPKAKPEPVETKPKKEADIADSPPQIDAQTRAKLNQLEAKNVELQAQALQLRNELAEAQREVKQAQRAAADAKRDTSDRERDLQAQVASLKGQLEKAPRTDPALNQCHSCVRLCPLTGRCDKSTAELVCGWGTGRSQAQAQQRARAECDGALAGMVSDGVFSRVEGKCPRATCQ